MSKIAVENRKYPVDFSTGKVVKPKPSTNTSFQKKQSPFLWSEYSSQSKYSKGHKNLQWSRTPVR
jgi:hypothetical protein